MLLGLLSSSCNWLIESQVFFPDKTLAQTPDDVRLLFEDIWFVSSDGVRLHGWLIPARPKRYLLLFCHGNAGNISHRLDNINKLHQIGVSVLIFDYRGYGRSQGRISEKGFYLDSEAAHQVASEWAEQYQAKLVIFGRSLGGIAAVHVAAMKGCDGLILESTFSNMGAMARAHYFLPFVESLLEHRLNAVGEIGRVGAPILFFHGDRDNIVPIRLGRDLYEAAPQPKELVILPGAGHNDTYLVAGQPYFDKIKAFLDGL
ncbi:MAG: alpha/beta hydrolase [Deltaproteobacteria bacterium]|nr:MAG: alpha/beta hydrolase [Deltaproteobacteria bacterium]